MQAAPDSTSAPAADASAPSTTAQVTSPSPSPGENQRGLVRNTFYLTAAQAVTIPVSVVSNALIGRYLGSEEFGHLYLATTLCSFAVLGLEWGLQGSMPALVSRDRAKAGAYLGTSLLFRAFSSVLAAAVLALVCLTLGYQQAVLWAVALSFPLAVLNSVAAGFKDTIRGFERTDIPAIAHVAQQMMMLMVLVPVLVLGGRLPALLIAHMAVAGLTVLYLRGTLGKVGISRLSFDPSAIKPFLTMGTPFVFFSLALVLGPNINATFLNQLTPPEVVGWFGVSQRLVGLLIFPASALVGALYPTLCRLHGEDPAEFVRVSRGSLYGVTLLAIPAAVGCGMFPEIGVSIFGTKEFHGALDHLRVMSLFILLVYFSMPLGIAILAANRQRVWTLVQCVCLVISLAGNPFLVPYFQRWMGNGAVGTCITLVLSEVWVVGCGIALSPKGLFDRSLAKSLALSLLAGAAMVGVAYVTKPVSLFLAVPAAVATYGVVAWFSGAVQPSTVDMLKGMLGRKLARFRA
jgi:O-antigen/teichoic acid export membrane protein